MRAPRSAAPVWKLVAVFVSVKLLLHLAANGLWGFHRDELLYLAMGAHLDWGFWSNPPSIGLFGWLAQHLPGDGTGSVRLIPALLGAMLVGLTGLLARELGGGRAAVAMACLSALLSPSLLRISVLFQPVVFDVFYWTLAFYFVVRYLNTGRGRWLWWVGLAVGLGLMNKYSVAFLVLGLVAALPLTPARTVFTKRAFWGAVGLALAVVLPNLIWQARNGFPVVHHMRDLHETQLVHVSGVDFVLEQFLNQLPVAAVWVLGLVFLFGARGRAYRLLGWVYAVVVLLLLVLGGKSYYTLGLYPMLFAAGGVWLEERVRRWVQATLFAVAAVVAVLVSPLSIPYLSVPDMAAYGERFVAATGVDAPMRWEGGRVHALPQDYADMLGWEEVAGLVAQAYRAAPDGVRTVVYCENYGQASAVERFARGDGLPRPLSFSDSYRLWTPATLPPDAAALVYVNDDLGEDVAALFADVRLVGTVATPYARERGTRVYLCLQPRESLPAFWYRRTGEIPGLRR